MSDKPYIIINITVVAAIFRISGSCCLNMTRWFLKLINAKSGLTCFFGGGGVEVVWVSKVGGWVGGGGGVGWGVWGGVFPGCVML